MAAVCVLLRRSVVHVAMFPQNVPNFASFCLKLPELSKKDRIAYNSEYIIYYGKFTY